LSRLSSVLPAVALAQVEALAKVETLSIQRLEGHALSWPDATERVPPINEHAKKLLPRLFSVPQAVGSFRSLPEP
jgi:hypothetical protein